MTLPKFLHLPRIVASAAFLSLLLAATATAQKLVKFESNGQLSAAAANERINALFTPNTLEPTRAAIELYKVRYTSTDEKGKPVELTGLVAWPAGGASKGLVVFCHGTIVDRDRSPSRYRGGSEGGEAAVGVLAFASGGYAVALPDYLGLGDHKKPHPYPLSKVNARSGVDIIPAVRELANQQKYDIAKPLYVTGYSEGGGVAMALTQMLEKEKGEMFRVTRSAPSAGPYDLSGTMLDFFLEPNTDQIGFVLRMYLLGYSAHYFHKRDGIKLREFFKPALADAVAINYGLNRSDDDILKALGITGALMRANNSLANVLNPKFLNAIKRRDQRNRFIRELAANNTYDWRPNTPILLIHLKSDTVVPSRNTEVAYAAMRRRGTPDPILRKHLIENDSLNHVTAMPPAAVIARMWFDGSFGKP
ncbi:MAG: alpha/beta fold hydrolase [Acidobacteria bacterium]|nr:alpha/beta fold hydrolase [Acidobacteriota bacterium]